MKIVAMVIGVMLLIGVGYVVLPADDTENVSMEHTEIQYAIDAADFINPAELVTKEPQSSSLSETEVTGLLLMREEEKLARDVYLMLADMWGLNIFSNIARSEQTHMDTMKTLLGLYAIEDPVRDDSVGTFSNPDLAVLYTQLVESGKASLNDALIVGATIEDLDIYDLERLMEGTAEENILRVYANLQKGSRNHLRAFVRQLEARGGSYEPQYISTLAYREIIDAPQERGRAR